MSTYAVAMLSFIYVHGEKHYELHAESVVAEDEEEAEIKAAKLADEKFEVRLGYIYRVVKVKEIG